MRQTLSARASAPATTAHHLALYGGRFQGVTDPHLKNYRTALDHGDHGVLLIGSHNQSRDLRNPFTSEERIGMWRECLTPDELKRTTFICQEDVGNRVRWSSAVQTKVSRIADERGIKNPSVAIIGHRKDGTSEYLDDFEAYDLIEQPNIDGISASDVRDEFFRIGETPYFEKWLERQKAMVPQGTIAFLDRFFETDHYAKLAIEAKKLDDYMGKWESVPFPVIFNTADAIILCGSKILMVRRKGHPGKGYWALPGGFVEHRQTVFDAALDETFQESKLDVSRQTLANAFVGMFVQDDPYRSTRGRTITFAHVFRLVMKAKGRTAAERHASLKPPRVKGGDDAELAGWFEIDEVRAMRAQIFEDHAIMIDKALDMLAPIIGR